MIKTFVGPENLFVLNLDARTDSVVACFGEVTGVHNIW